MSHAANLRKRVASQDSPAKRRRIESEPQLNGISAITNGSINNGLDKKFVAIETTDVKRRKGKPQLDADATVGHGEEEDTSMLDIAQTKEAMSDSEDEDEEEEDSASDSEDDDLTNGAAVPTSSAAPGEEATLQEEPSFGELLSARAPTHIIVEPSTSAENLTTARSLTIPTATSLGTVLTQALRTNDTELLESCLQVPNLDSIRATIERLHSSLATGLLHKLAERLHRRPGRAGSLMVWVQWTIVAHGGYLANQPAAVKQLHTLYNVVKQRAAGLQPLLSLKGKLDMLEAQMRLRQSMQDRIRPGGVARNQDEAGVVYVEGEEDEVDAAEMSEVDGSEDSDQEDDDSVVDELAQIAPALAKRSKKTSALDSVVDLESEDDDDDMPDTLPNGVDGTDDNGSSADEDEEDDLIDDEAEESDGSESELDEEEIDYNEEDLIDDGSSSEEEQAPIPIPVKASKKSVSKRK